MSIQYLFSTLILGVTCLTTFAQQDEQWTHYYYNQQYYNPGYSGIEGISRATLIHRSQWLGYQATVAEDRAGGAPSQQNLTLTQPLKIFKSKVVNSGVGLVVNMDRLGPIQKQDAKLDLAYHYKPRFGGTFGFGARVGIEGISVNGNILRENEQGDLVVDAFGNSRTSQVKPTFGAGIYYNSTKFYVSAALHDVNQTEFDFNGGQDVSFNLDRSIWLSGGYNIFWSRLVLTPNVHYKADFNHSSYNLGLNAQLDDHKYWAGFHIRQSFVNRAVNDGGGKQIISDDISFLIGMSFLDQNALRVGYGFDLVTSGGAAKAATSHEIILSYALPLLLENRRIPVKDPRYRHE